MADREIDAKPTGRPDINDTVDPDVVTYPRGTVAFQEFTVDDMMASFDDGEEDGIAPRVGTRRHAADD